MNRVKRRFFVYGASVFAVAMALLVPLTYSLGFGAILPLEFIAFSAYTFMAVSLGFRIPGLGYTSLDRAVQVASLLIFGPVAAAWMVVVTSFSWPLINMRRNQDSLGRALARGMHNSGMLVLVVLAGGGAYSLLHGRYPLVGLEFDAALALVVVLLVMQTVNEAMMLIVNRVNQPETRPRISPFNSVTELAAAPLGIIAALVYTGLDLAAFVLFVLLFTVLAWLMRLFAGLRADLERQVDALVAVNRVGQAVSRSLILDDLVELIFEECSELIEFSSFYLVLYDAEAEELDFRVHYSQGQRMPGSRRSKGTGLLGWIVDNNRSVLITDWDDVPEEIRKIVVIVGDRPTSFIGVPVAYEDEVLGVISVQTFGDSAFGEAELRLMETFAGQAAAAIGNARMFTELAGYRDRLEIKVEERTQELRALSDNLRRANAQKEQLLDELQRKTDELDRQTKEDSLTGLYNRRYVDGFLSNEIKRSQRFDHELSVAMADLDRFKVINDRYSHGIGDQVLRSVARILKDGCRGIDVIGRYGGEEFVLIFPETGLEAATEVCEKLREAIQAHDWMILHPELAVTTSIGVADARGRDHHQALLAAADEKLYAAKAAGRNKVLS